MKDIQLSKRLKYVADFITPSYVLADIGTDHGFVPIYQVLHRDTPKAYAMDINKGPLERADEHIKEAGLERKIETRLSDGMHKLKKGEAESVLIAGMGGALMVKILTEGKEALEDVKELILSPHTEADLVRCFIRDSHFVIDKEGMVFDSGKYYVVIHAKRANQTDENKMYTDDGNCEDNRDYDKAGEVWRSYIRFGKLLIKEKEDVFIEFLEKEMNTYKNIIVSLNGNETEAGINRKQEIEELIRLATLAKEMKI